MNWLFLSLVLSNGGAFGYETPATAIGVFAEGARGRASFTVTPTDKMTVAATTVHAAGMAYVGGRVFLVAGSDVGYAVTPRWTKIAVRVPVGVGYRGSGWQFRYTHLFPLSDMNALHADTAHFETLGRVGAILSAGTASYVNSGVRRRCLSVGVGVRVGIW